jgi:phosphate uptake regulator
MEFRKLISFGKSSFVISVPKTWIVRNNLKKGSLVSVEAKDPGLLIMPNVDNKNDISRKSVEIEVTGIDRTSLLYAIRSAYKMGYDDIKLLYKKPIAMHYRIDDDETIISIVHEEVNRLIGVEVVQQKEDFCIIKDLAELSATEFNSSLKRVFLLVTDASKDFAAAIKTGDALLLKTIEEKHNSITKFVSYCLRLINKGKYPFYKKGLILYHIISNLDKIADILKYSARDILSLNVKMKKETIEMLTCIFDQINSYHDLFYKFDFKKSSELYKSRSNYLDDIKKISHKVPPKELLVIEKTASLMEIITDISEARMALEHKD